MKKLLKVLLPLMLATLFCAAFAACGNPAGEGDSGSVLGVYNTQQMVFANEENPEEETVINVGDAIYGDSILYADTWVLELKAENKFALSVHNHSDSAPDGEDFGTYEIDGEVIKLTCENENRNGFVYNGIISDGTVKIFVTGTPIYYVLAK
ncbi:MAG: hypothetical protein K2I20_04780 [Clostridia bacterium]|nr:hypothetical protein [Clostridia bacterium]